MLIQDWVARVFFVIGPVPHGQALGLDFAGPAIILLLQPHPGVHQQMPAVRKCECTPEKHPP